MMKKILLVLVTVITFAMNGKAQTGSDRLSLGVGCLYQNGWISPSHTNMRANTTTRGSFLPMVISNGMNATPASISVRNHSGRITAAMGSVSPTSPV